MARDQDTLTRRRFVQATAAPNDPVRRLIRIQVNLWPTIMG
jgi:hypothetical protein